MSISGGTRSRVELIAQPVLNLDGLRRFLEAVDTRWPQFRSNMDSNLDLGDHDGEWLADLVKRLSAGSLGGDGGHQDCIDGISAGGGHIFRCVPLGFVIWDIPEEIVDEISRVELRVFPFSLGGHAGAVLITNAETLKPLIERFLQAPGALRAVGHGLLRAGRLAIPQVLASFQDVGGCDASVD